jgi:hypothetical protein
MQIHHHFRNEQKLPVISISEKQTMKNVLQSNDMTNSSKLDNTY